GFPFAIWSGALFALTLLVLFLTTQVMAAGPLLRQYGARPAVLLPYLERTLPVMLFLSQAPGIALVSFLFKDIFDVRPFLIWYVPLFVSLALALVVTLRGWPGPMRQLLPPVRG